MPDYDPKSIPILDDIIEGENADKDEAVSIAETVPEVPAPEDMPDDNTLDLFAADPEDLERTEPEIGAFDGSPEALEEDTGNAETKTIESALIDYQLEDNKIEKDDSDIIDYQPEIQSASSIQAIDSSTPVGAIPPIDLDAIVDGVVKQMMPDLEKQLRFLIQQALEEKLGNSDP